MKLGWSKPHTHSTPTNLALFWHKITLYRFNQGAHTIAGGLKWEQGLSANECLTLLPALSRARRNTTAADTNHARRASLAQCAAAGQVQARHHDAPLSTQLCSPNVPARSQLRSASRHQVVVPRYNTSTFGRRAFSVAGPTVWNSLPDKLRDPSISIDSFRRQLKTFLFSD